MAQQVLDDFRDISTWQTVASGLAEASLRTDPGVSGQGLRLDFDFHGGGGFVVARRALNLALPEVFAFDFMLRGEGLPNRLEFKLVDRSGLNVWWYREEAFEPRSDWQSFRIRSRQIEFAWGPLGGGPPRDVAAIEWVIAAGPGGRGSLSFAELTLEDLTPTAAPLVAASSCGVGCSAVAVLDDDPATCWQPDRPGSPCWLEFDFGAVREYGGLVIHWTAGSPSRDFRVGAADRPPVWASLYEAHSVGTHRSYVYLPGGESRYLRLEIDPLDGESVVGIDRIEIRPFEFSRSLETFFQHIAAMEPPGWYPKYLCGRQTYWSPVATPDGSPQALLNEEGMVEFDFGSASVEPFIHDGERLLNWADASLGLSLVDDALPLPVVRWRVQELELTVTLVADDSLDCPAALAVYRITNLGKVPRDLRFFLACRSFQVTPPWQAHQGRGGLAAIRRVRCAGPDLWVNDVHRLSFPAPPDAWGAATFDQGGVLEAMCVGAVPSSDHVDDPFGYASAALAWNCALAPGESREISLYAPFVKLTRPPAAVPAGFDAAARIAAARVGWTARLGHVTFIVPEAARAYVETFKTAAAHVLVNRDGAALQPGPRRYSRSWIRDGAIMATALLRIGCYAEAKAYAEWYATFQKSDGDVPCCVDRDGPDWLREFDSQGQLIHLIAECYRFTGDQAFLEALWPNIRKSVEFIETLRATRLTQGYQTDEKRARFGLLPESASHEGYLAHPVHAFWDDFWAIRGLRDAAEMAAVLGDTASAGWCDAQAQSLTECVRTSMASVMRDREIDFVPGSVEWADFDPTATANGVTLSDDLLSWFPEALTTTFERYLAGFRARLDAAQTWSNYSAYEVRIVGALVHMGWRTAALEVADYLLADRRPRAWNQWPEISWRDPQTPAHIGDLPHSWISAEYVLACRSLFAYERYEDRTLIIAAGIPGAWLEDGRAVGVNRLPTPFGELSYTLRRASGGHLVVNIEPLRDPRGECRIVVRPPLEGVLLEARDAGGLDCFDSALGAVVVCRLPAEVTLICGSE